MVGAKNSVSTTYVLFVSTSYFYHLRVKFNHLAATAFVIPLFSLTLLVFDHSCSATCGSKPFPCTALFDLPSRCSLMILLLQPVSHRFVVVLQVIAVCFTSYFTLMWFFFLWVYVVFLSMFFLAISIFCPLPLSFEGEFYHSASATSVPLCLSCFQYIFMQCPLELIERLVFFPFSNMNYHIVESNEQLFSRNDFWFWLLLLLLRLLI